MDLLLRLLEFDPVKRISAEEALDHPYFKELPAMKVGVEMTDDGVETRGNAAAGEGRGALLVAPCILASLLNTNPWVTWSTASRWKHVQMRLFPFLFICAVPVFAESVYEVRWVFFSLLTTRQHWLQPLQNEVLDFFDKETNSVGESFVCNVVYSRASC